MDSTLLDFTVILSSVLGYFVSISLVASPFYKSDANNYLSISLFLLTSNTLLGWYDSNNPIIELLQSIMWEFLIPVTFFTYFLIQVKHRFLKESWLKWLYLPFLGALIVEVLLHLYFNLTVDYSTLNDESFAVQLFYDLEEILSLAYNVGLIFWGRYLIRRAVTISREKKRWLLRLNLFIICIVIVWLLSDIEYTFFNSEFYTNMLWVTVSFLSWWILYYGVFKLQIVSQKDEIHNFLTAKRVAVQKVKKKKNEVTTLKVIAQLHHFMDEEELYKNSMLSRLDLANKLGISEGYLSQIINEELNKSIIQFVNDYRIDAAKELLHNPTFNKYAIDAIGMEAGFKSKSAFYSTFKTTMGMSPGVYRKLQKKS